MDTTLKTCFKCGREKPRCDFYPHPQMGDGLLGKCKECTKRDTRRRYYAKYEDVREYDKQRAMRPERVEARKAYLTTEDGKRARRIAQQRWVKLFPERRYAAGVVARAIRSGKLVRQPCECCGAPQAQAHHDDYSKPLCVRWLCPKHHREVHNTIRSGRIRTTKTAA